MNIELKRNINMKISIVLLFFALLFFTTLNATGTINNQKKYAGSDACQACHEGAYETWKSSKHGSPFNPEQKKSEACNVCHTTAYSASNQGKLENYVGCESCHGPGEEHILSEGDTAKIISGSSADICGRCHNGNESGDDISWAMEYMPGMKLSDIKELKLIPVSPDKLVPSVKEIHPSLTYNMWLVSGHAKTPDREIDIEGKKWEGPITCTACHNPHYSNNIAQLVMDTKELCKSCHFQGAVLKGFGAKGIEETRSLHTAAPCISCHMTENNHLMKMIRPDDPDLSEDRLDSCSDCHEIKDRKMRANQLQDMEAWYNEAMAPVQEDLKIVEQKLKENPDILSTELKAKLEDTRANLSIIINDGSNGVHNLDYALEIMYQAKRNLKEINKTIN